MKLSLSLFREFVISGLALLRKEWGWKKRRKDTWTNIVNPEYIFFDGAMQDVRHWDCSIIGQIHDLSLQEVKTAFPQKTLQM